MKLPLHLWVLVVALSSASSLNAAVSCPHGLVNDAYPGKCNRYVDDDKNGICDLSEDDVAQAVACDLSLLVSPVGSGTVSISPVKDEYVIGESIVVEAKPAEGYQFSGWSGDVAGTEVSVTVTLSSDFSATASFIEATENDPSAGEGGVGVDPQPVSVMTIVYPEAAGIVTAGSDLSTLKTGDVLQLSATSSGAAAFVKWDGDIQSVENPLSTPLTEDLFVIAVFDDGSNTVSDASLVAASVWPSEAGTIASDSALDTVADNEVVILSAVPNPGYVFKSWIGDVSSVSNPLSITVSGKTQVIAEFESTSIPVFKAVDIGEGWFHSEWYGKMRIDYLPYFFHENAGWQYCVSEAAGGIYLYDHAMGMMLWTSEEVYPYLFVNGENPGWIWYFKDTVTPNRWFYDFRSESLKPESEIAKTQ